ncbi:MAG: hypothetical protein LBV43_02410 [Prevotella sp.]|nr:hypothetical protein [Prevotella sp.]
MGIKSQVTVGTGKAAVPGALLQLKQQETTGGEVNSNKGLGLPRVSLEKRKQLYPMFEADGTGYKDAVKADEDIKHIGLVVYNLTDNTDVEKDPDELLCPGPYVWEGDIWVRLLSPCKPLCEPENSENCIIVDPSASTPVLIPVGKPYIVWKERADLGNLELEGEVSVELVWQDTQSLIKEVDLAEGDQGACSQIKITTNGGGLQGNALVAVRVGPNGDDSDPIRWSWHLWVTNESSIVTYPHNNSEKDYEFMDRNLGAISASETVDAMGLTYQWGRKDPFTASLDFSPFGSFRKLYDIDNNELTEVNEHKDTAPVGTGIQHAAVTVSNNLQNSILNPRVFYFGTYNGSTNNETNADWYTTDETGASSDDNLWETDGTKKSPFDPCPAGWRVPLNSAGGLSPWYHFRTVPDGWDNASPAAFNENGAQLNALTSPVVTTKLGYYPHGLHRRARAYSEPCGGVGGDPSGSNFAGGLFATCNILHGVYESSYWTANPIAGTPNARAEFFYYQPGWIGDLKTIDPKDMSRSTGASVRCVRIDTTP